MPRVPEFFKFRTEEYKLKVKALSNDVLRDKIFKHRRIEHGSAAASIAAGVSTAFTMGATALAIDVANRKGSVARQKLVILEKEWQERGLGVLGQRKRDIIVPVAAGLVMLGHGTGLEHAVISAGVNHAATLAMNRWDAHERSQRSGGSGPEIISQNNQGSISTSDTDLIFEEYPCNPHQPEGSFDPPSYYECNEKGVGVHSPSGLGTDGSRVPMMDGPQLYTLSPTDSFSSTSPTSPTPSKDSSVLDEFGRYRPNKTLLKARQFSATWREQNNLPALSYKQEIKY